MIRTPRILVIVGDDLKSFNFFASQQCKGDKSCYVHSDKKNIKVERQRRNGGLIKTSKRFSA